MNTILSLDLKNEISEAKRQLMFVELARLNWVKITSPTTLWKKTWKDGFLPDDYILATKEEVAASATVAQGVDYEATAFATPSEPVTWKASFNGEISFAAALQCAPDEAEKESMASVAFSSLRMDFPLPPARRKRPVPLPPGTPIFAELGSAH